MSYMVESFRKSPGGFSLSCPAFVSFEWPTSGQPDLGGLPQRPAEQVWNGASSASDREGGMGYGSSMAYVWLIYG